MAKVIFSADRAYAHKEFGNVGNAGWRLLDDGKAEFAINGTWRALPADGVAHLMGFALQTLQDAYAGAKTAAEATALFLKKADRIATGAIGTRAAGTDDETDAARDVVRPAVKVKMAAEWKAASPTDRNKMLDAVVAKNADKESFRLAVAERVKAIRAAREALRGLAASADLDI